MPESAFCIDLGESLLKVTDLANREVPFSVLKMGMEDVDQAFFRTDSDESVKKTAESLTKLIKQLKITGKNVRIVVPDAFSYNQFIEMPQLNEKELLSALKYQADQFIPMPLEDVNLDAEMLYEDDKAKKILAFVSAAPKAIIQKIERLMQSSYLIPISIETETSAIGRFLTEIFKKTKHQSSDANSGLLFVNLSSTTSSLYYFNQNLGLLTNSHNFSLGYNIFLKEIQVNLNVDPKKAFELLKTFGLVQNESYKLENILRPAMKDFITQMERFIADLKNKKQPPVKAIYFLNDALRFHSLEKIVGSYFGIPSALFNPYSFFARNNIVDFFKDDLGYFVASCGGLLR